MWCPDGPGAKTAENARKNARILSVNDCVFPVIETLHIFAMSLENRAEQFLATSRKTAQLAKSC